MMLCHTQQCSGCLISKSNITLCTNIIFWSFPLSVHVCLCHNSVLDHWTKLEMDTKLNGHSFCTSGQTNLHYDVVGVLYRSLDWEVVDEVFFRKLEEA